MRLWILQPRDDLGDANPWDPWFDKAFGFVVRAETEQDARLLAQEKSGDEVREFSAWMDARFSTCLPLEQDGPPGIVLRDFAAA